LQKPKNKITLPWPARENICTEKKKKQAIMCMKTERCGKKSQNMVTAMNGTPVIYSSEIQTHSLKKRTKITQAYLRFT
jgi:hypothetical protein